MKEHRSQPLPSIAFGQPIEGAASLSDEQFFAAVQRTSTKPSDRRNATKQTGRAKEARSNGAPDPNWRVLFLSSNSGTRSVRIGKRVALPPHERQSLWSRLALGASPRASILIAAWEAFAAGKKTGRARHVSAAKNGRPIRHFARSISALDLNQAIMQWIGECEGNPSLSLLETLILFEILRDAGGHLAEPVARTIWRMGLTAAITRSVAATDTQPSHSLIAAELAWQAGLLFSRVSGAQETADAGRDILRRAVLDSTDVAGVPAAGMIDRLPAWLTSLVRAREWGCHFGRPLFDRAEEKRFRAILTSVAGMCRADGSLALSNGLAKGLHGVWTTAAASVLQRVRATSPAIQYLASLGSRPSNGHAPAARVRPVFQSDVSRLACLRNDWRVDANSLVVSYDRRFPTLELSAIGKILLSGDWEIDLKVDGRPLAISGSWTCGCWYSDEEADYLELQTTLNESVRIERQILLSRKDDPLFLGDVIYAAPGARVDYASRLPLVGGTKVIVETESRACRIATKAASARVLPVGLPYSRVVGTAGGLKDDAGRMELRQTGIGGLYAPLVIDWTASRKRAPAVWQPLTVAQNGATLSASVAAGFRLQIGKMQWLIFRSLLHSLEPRSVLGHHTMYETVIGRFLPNGTVEPIILVEQNCAERKGSSV
jgi:hypothetical protein